MGLIEATLEGAKLRLRPIIMTSMAFGFGVLPLMLATGAGAGAQKAIGTGAFGGVVTATFLVTLFVPLFYVLIEKTFGKRRRNKAAKTEGANSRRRINDMKRNLFLLLSIIVFLLAVARWPRNTRNLHLLFLPIGRQARPTRKRNPRHLRLQYRTLPWREFYHR